MPRKRKNEELQNTTASKLDGTPFDKVKELNTAKAIHEREEWEKIDRAAARRKLLLKDDYKPLLNPLFNGIQASYSGSTKNGLGKGFLNDDESVSIEVDEQWKTEDKAETMSAIVTSLSRSVVSSYFEAIGLGENQSLDSLEE